MVVGRFSDFVLCTLPTYISSICCAAKVKKKFHPFVVMNRTFELFSNSNWFFVIYWHVLRQGSCLFGMQRITIFSIRPNECTFGLLKYVTHCSFASSLGMINLEMCGNRFKRSLWKIQRFVHIIGQSTDSFECDLNLKLWSKNSLEEKNFSALDQSFRKTHIFKSISFHR